MSPGPPAKHRCNLMLSRALPAFVWGIVAVAGGLITPTLPALPLPHSGKSNTREVAAFQALDRYWREAHSRPSTEETAVPFRIDAELPKLHKRGVLRGVKVITGAGRIIYTQLHFVGDNVIRSAVIARFLSADTKLKTGAEAADIAPNNYRLSYKGTADYDRRTAFVFVTQPKRKGAGLFKGELWIDTETARPLREWGELVKSPSAFLHHVNFVRDYGSSNADPAVRRIIIRLQAAFAGPVELTMWLDKADADDAGEQ
jgi:hypothetical protein